MVIDSIKTIATVELVAEAVKVVKVVVEATFDQTTAITTIQETIQIHYVVFRDTIVNGMIVHKTVQVYWDWIKTETLVSNGIIIIIKDAIINKTIITIITDIGINHKNTKRILQIIHFTIITTNCISNKTQVLQHLYFNFLQHLLLKGIDIWNLITMSSVSCENQIIQRHSLCEWQLTHASRGWIYHL